MNRPAIRIGTTKGPAEALVHAATDPVATVVLTHGAGGDVDTPDLVRLTEELPPQGFQVVLVRMPWRVAGKPLPPRPAVIDECFSTVLEQLRAEGAIAGPLVVGGRSAGARSACRLGSSYDASGVLALSFPLHPPGKPERSRLEELTGAGVPTLVLQGERDPFGRPAEYPADLAAELVPVPAADHSLRVPKRAGISQGEADQLVAETVLEWLVREVVGNR